MPEGTPTDIACLTCGYDLRVIKTDRGTRAGDSPGGVLGVKVAGDGRSDAVA